MDVNKIKVNQNKEKILTWLEEANIPHTLVDIEKLGRSDLLFSITAGNPQIAIYTMRTIPDRILVQADITIGKQHEEIIKKMSDPDHAKFIVKIQTLLSTFNVRHRFILKDGKTEIIRIHLFIHDDVMTKDIFLQDLSRVQETFIVALNQISLSFGLTIDTQNAQQENDTRDRPGVT